MQVTDALQLVLARLELERQRLVGEYTDQLSDDTAVFEVGVEVHLELRELGLAEI